MYHFLMFDQITTKKRYSHLAVGWNVWEFHELGLLIKLQPEQKRYSCLVIGFECLGGSIASRFGMFGGFHELGLLIKLRQKKGTVIWPLVGMYGWFYEFGLFW
jgi:hypothetical protein